jgi:hypothetical protein
MSFLPRRQHAFFTAFLVVIAFAFLAACSSTRPGPAPTTSGTAPGTAPPTSASPVELPTMPHSLARQSPAPSGPSAPGAPRVLPVAAGSVIAIGDSVMLDSQPSLVAAIPGIVVDAAVSRQVSSGISAVAALSAAGQLSRTVVFHLGTNGSFSPAALSQLEQLTTGHQLVVLTSHCGYCSWTPTNNATIHAGCTTGHHCVVADWQQLASAHPEWFGSDGVHMAVGGAGAKAYAQLVLRALTTP